MPEIALLERTIEQQLARKSRVLIAIDGNSGAGKSTLGRELSDRFGANLLHMDEFFLSPAQKTASRLAEPGGNVDYERFKLEVLEPLVHGLSFTYRPFDCKTGELASAVSVKPNRLSIVEGVYSLHPALAEAYDLKLFCSIRPDEQRARILARSGKNMLRRFETEWIPLENAYFEALHIQESCDLSL